MSNKKEKSQMIKGPMAKNTQIVEKAKDFKGSTKKLLKYLGKYKIAIFFVMVIAITSTIFMVIGPKILGTATTELFNGLMRKVSGNGTGVDFDKIKSIMLKLILLYSSSMLLSCIQGYIMTKVANTVTYKLRKEIYDKIHKLPFSYYDKMSKGDVLSRITNDVDSINQSLSQSVVQIITSITTIIGILIMMISISIYMTGIALITLPLSGAIIILIVKKSQKYFTNQQNYIAKINGHIEENYSCHNIIKAFNREEVSKEEFNEYNKTLYNSAWKANFLSSTMMPIMNFIGNLGYVGISILGGYFAAKKIITVGDIQAFIQYMRQFTQPLGQISQISNVLQQTIAASERVFEFLEETEEVEDKKDAIEVDFNDFNANISFENVNFGYKENKTIINNFNIDIKEGQKVAIVGKTGAGKTTIVKLLMRFYDVTSGSIKINGIDLRKYKRDSLRSIFGMVLQDTWLFNGSIKDNIKYAKEDTTDEEIIKVAKAAEVHHFIETLPNSYDMIINEEASNISVGQKQLLTIARVLLSDPKVLILDEATSSVDTKTETSIQKAMDNLTKGRTTFIIAHRLSTIRNADVILVMDNGDIVEQGNHYDLLKLNKKYASLYNSQFEHINE